MAKQMTDRELDAAVAEKVMRIDLSEKYVRRYSTDIAAAWQVVEKMRDRGFEWSFDGDGGGGGVFRWRAVVWVSDLENVEPVGISESMPRAICLAALAAVEAKSQ